MTCCKNEDKKVTIEEVIGYLQQNMPKLTESERSKVLESLCPECRLPKTEKCPCSIYGGYPPVES